MSSKTPRHPPQKRKAMIAYLSGHFRYRTAAPWNRSTSYARCIKVDRLNEIPRELEGRAVEMLGVTDILNRSGFSQPLDEFQTRHEDRWQWGINGRSGGYIVLYQGGREPSGYHSFCRACGQQNCLKIIEAAPPDDIRESLIWAFHRAAQHIPPTTMLDNRRTWNPDSEAWTVSLRYDEVWPILARAAAAGWSYTKSQLVMHQEAAAVKTHHRPRCGFDRRCGRCGADARVNYPRLHTRTYCKPYLGVDEERDFEEWDMDSLRDRTKVVWEFDRAVDQGIANFVDYCRNYRVEDQIVLVPKTIKVAVEDQSSLTT